MNRRITGKQDPNGTESDCMSEENGSKKQLDHSAKMRDNTTHIWSTEGEPVGSAAIAADHRFVHRALVFSGIAVLLLAALGFLAYRNMGAVKEAYASVLIAQSRFTEADQLIRSMEDTASKDLLQKKLYYTLAESYLRSGKITEAIPFYEAAGDYPGADGGLQKNGYLLAQGFESDGDYLEASETYGALGDYLDSAQKSDECLYTYAIECMDNDKYEEAMRLFYSLGSYENAEEYAEQAAAELSQSDGAGELVSLLVGLSEEQLAERARLKTAREALPVGVIATGYQHTIARMEDGTVLAAGSNLEGQCNTTEWTNIVSIAAGAYHSVGLRMDGTVVAAGMNTYHQCDVGQWTNVVSVYAGAYNTVAITRDGKILSTGYQNWDSLRWREISALSIGDYALCGVMENGQPLTTAEELVTSEYYDLVALDAATANSAGLKADGTVVANGLDVTEFQNILAIDCTPNGVFALDDKGLVHSRAFSFAHLPDVSDWRNVISISASATHIVAVTADGRVLSRGESNMGQCDTQEWRLFTPAPTPDPSMEPETTPEP